MNLKQSVIVCIATIGICSCNQPTTNNNGKKADTVNAGNVTADNYLDSFKQSKDEKAFLTGLYKKQGLKAETDNGKPYRLLKLEDVKLYGGTKPYTLAYVDIIDGAMASWPWKQLFILDDKGEIKGSYLAEKFEPVVVFDHEGPLLVVKDETSKGHGMYHFVGIEKDMAKDFLNPQDWALLTTDGDGKIIPYTIKNKNKTPEIVFAGEYKHTPFTFTFIWNSQTNMFEVKDK
jgi:hypothetical protein